jgi:hypothetical protein
VWGYNFAVPSDPMPLAYAQQPPRIRRPFYVFLLPLLWLPAGIGSRIHHGDEFVPFIVAHLPAVPVVYFLQHHDIDALFLIAMSFNFVLMIGCGYLMDRLRVWRRACLLLPPLLIGLLLSRRFVIDTIPPRQTPWPPHAEWEPVFLFPAWAWAVYVFALLSLTITVFTRIVARVTRRSP